MPPAIGAQIAPFCLRNKGHRTFAHSAQTRQHGLFFRKQAFIQRHRRFPADHPRLHQPHRQVQALREGKGTGIAAFCVNRSTFVTTPRSTTTKCATSSAADHSFNPGQLSHFAAGIASATRKKAVCARASFSRIGWSDVIRLTLNCCAAGLFEGMRQLQHAGFSEGGAKYLQSHRQLAADLSARHRYPR